MAELPHGSIVQFSPRFAMLFSLRNHLPLLVGVLALLWTQVGPRAVAAQPARETTNDEAGTPAASTGNARTPKSPADLRRWLENMIWHHHFSIQEMMAATGLSQDEIAAATQKFQIRPDNRPADKGDGLRVLPYPGGRHPRIGFLDGAINPQRETKLSVFLPWNRDAYVVLDIPEAIWWKPGPNRELLYLAHTHIDTTWSRQGIALPPLEWQELPGGKLKMQRRLPNGIEFGTEVQPAQDHLAMRMWLTNGTARTLTGLQVQNCVMFKGAPELASESNDNKVFQSPYAACGNGDRNRWVITAWQPCDRVWGNAPCPCMHSDPRFPDCDPGATVELRGWLSCYEGTDLPSELQRIQATGWDKSSN